MHAVARPAQPFRDDRASMYAEQQNVNGWTVIREPRTTSASEDSYSDDGERDRENREMDVDRRQHYQPPPHQQQQQQWYRDVSVPTHYPQERGLNSWQPPSYRDHPHNSPYTLPPLTTSSSSSSGSSRRSPTLPVHLSLPIPASLPFPSSKSPISAPPHNSDHHNTLLHAYHPASAHPSSRDRDRDRDYSRPTLPPPSTLEPYPHPSPRSPHSPSGLLTSLNGHHQAAPSSPKTIVYTDDATTKLGSYIRRRCFNCHTPDSAAWRRSSMHPGKVLCNKCGLYERTHQKDRPHDPAELRSKPRKGGLASTVNASAGKLAGPGVSAQEVPPRPNHASLISPAEDRRHAHSLNALLNTGADRSNPPTRSNSGSPGSKPLHLSPILPPPQQGGYSPHGSYNQLPPPRRSSHSPADDRERERERYEDERRRYEEERRRYEERGRRERRYEDEAGPKSAVEERR
ncbi:hypothetical protein M422DRAFT_248231 [Sphaerobolus stellatus SS14]|uniref:GATA-type domain-containing protein n=1 Tax=Sphaerobolus stellatus (strain SS14) TaxID=990650 RepID=A0A0C9W4Z0_SPHS4|nr:hypothetical protein M422DRAFT_248231 [Sphaerobolus stellatus SS14]